MRKLLKLLATSGALTCVTLLAVVGVMVPTQYTPVAGAAPGEEVEDRALFECSGESTYYLTVDGAIRSTLDNYEIATAANLSGYSQTGYFNGLGITKDGTTAYAVERYSYYNWAQSARVFKYNANSGWKPIGDWIPTKTNLIAGAVDPSTGKYYFGGYSAPDGNGLTTFGLYEHDPVSGKTSFKATISVGALSDQNGDIAFDAEGNLFIVQGGGDAAVLYSVPRAVLQKANNGNPIQEFSSFDLGYGLSQMNGIAFTEKGHAVVGNLNEAFSFSQLRWAKIPGTTREIASSGDLASCISPPTIKIEKYAPEGLVKAKDSFEITLNQDGYSVSTVTANEFINTPESGGDGLMQAVMGPAPVTRGVTLKFEETAGTNTDLSKYSTTWMCSVDGKPLDNAAGKGTAGEVAIPETGKQIACKFVNVPRRGAFKITKIVEGNADPDLEYSGTWTCTEPHPKDPQKPKTVTGKWSVKANEEWQSPADQVPAGYSCEITETAPENGPVASDPSWQWDGQPTIAPSVVAAAEAPPTITVTNRTKQELGSVSWQKVSSEATSSGATPGESKLLEGSVWELSDPDGNPTTIEDCVTSSAEDCADKADKDPVAGKFQLQGLKWGTYSLQEKRAPFGYLLDPTKHSFKIGKTGDASINASIGDIPNTPIAAPRIPLASGYGAEIYAITGGAVLALGVLTGLVGQRRNRKTAN